MSTYGTWTRRFLDVKVWASRSSENYEPPGPTTYGVEINGTAVEVNFRRGGGWYWNPRRDWTFLVTPLFVLEGDLSGAYLVRTEQSEDYPDRQCSSLHRAIHHTISTEGSS